MPTRDRVMFRVQHRRSQLSVVFDDGDRVVVHDDDGNVAFSGSRWLFDQCWSRGFFTSF